MPNDRTNPDYSKWLFFLVLGLVVGGVVTVLGLSVLYALYQGQEAARKAAEQERDEQTAASLRWSWAVSQRDDAQKELARDRQRKKEAEEKGSPTVDFDSAILHAEGVIKRAEERIKKEEDEAQRRWGKHPRDLP